MKGQRVVWPSRATVEIEEFEFPSLGDNEILVATECSLISPGTERAFLLGLPNAQGRYPSYPGYSNIGVVIDSGKDVDGFKIGDRVVSSKGHTSHFVATPDSLLKVTEPMLSSEEGVFFNLCTIAMQGVRKAKIELGEPVLVLGGGLIGLFAMQLAKLTGGLPAITADLSDYRLQLAKQVGADYTVNPEAKDLIDQLDKVTSGRGLAVVIEATGHPPVVNTAFQLADWHGRVVLLASTRGETERVNFYRDIHGKGLTVVGAHNSVRPRHESSPNFWTLRDDWELSLQLIAHRRVVVAPLITHRLAGTQAAEAYQLLMEWDQNLLGVVLNWED
ncbi:hypothetical protein C6502_07780 [Candidatus Poribacteria bacterium]|nr:MAG: hypothetical protein C6502_07780 [Candidatus Poribacteria bacterium]